MTSVLQQSFGDSHNNNTSIL